LGFFCFFGYVVFMLGFWFLCVVCFCFFTVGVALVVALKPTSHDTS